MTENYQVFSPDNFPINCEGGYYETLRAARAAIRKWVNNYKAQGYYSTIRNGERVRIPVNELKDYCDIQWLRG